MAWQRFGQSRPVATTIRLSLLEDYGVRPPKAKAVKRGPQPGSPAGVLARSPHSKELPLTKPAFVHS
ncbi:MAG: hypothetical protein ACR2HX_10520, partial [Pyrinomonadaceae bacterium]